jgi:uncharacterized membrane protein
MGGGNLSAILATGSLMFLSFTIGWSIPGTIFLIAFLMVGFNSLFPFIAGFIWLAIACYSHPPIDRAEFGVILFFIVLLLLMEYTARMMIAEEKKTTHLTKGNNTLASNSTHSIRISRIHGVSDPKQP